MRQYIPIVISVVVVVMAGAIVITQKSSQTNEGSRVEKIVAVGDFKKQKS